MANYTKNKGFTLVELSIVIVIIGLIVAGVVGGQALVAQSKLRSIITDYKKLSVATNAFKLEYGQLPGDFSEADSYWTTSNGNANGWVDFGSEMDRSIQHLSLAELIPGSYNSGEAMINKYGGYTVLQRLNTQYQLPTPQNIFTFRGNQSLSNPQSGLLKSKEAFSLDNKLDDGDPTTGIFISYGPVPFVGGGCMTAGWGGGPGSSSYNFNSDLPSCIVVFTCGKSVRNCVP